MAHLFGKCRKILAIGRNYKLHAEELGNKVCPSDIATAPQLPGRIPSMSSSLLDD